MKKEEMQPGRKYRGYGYINEFKEFHFEPEDTGSRAGREKSILKEETDAGSIALSETKNFLILKLNIRKSEDKIDYIKALGIMYNTIVKKIAKYEI